MADSADLRRLNHPSGTIEVPTSACHLEDRLREGGEEEDEFYCQSSPLASDFGSLTAADNSSNPALLDDYTASSFDLNLEFETPEFEYEESNGFFSDCEEDDEQMNFITDLFESGLASTAEDPISEIDSCPPEESSLGYEFATGLCVVGVDSESDSDDFQVNPGLIISNEISFYDRRRTETERQESEWENLSSEINRMEQMFLSSEIEESSSLLDDLLAMPVDVSDFDGIFEMPSNAFFEQLPEHENPSNGSPPASESAIENLPQMVLSIKENEVVTCGICKDEFTAGEKVTTMPCHHMYHGECIIPWLSIRNTCPVCRYELPTDNESYEKRKGEGILHGDGAAAYSMRYDSEEVIL